MPLFFKRASRLQTNFFITDSLLRCSVGGQRCSGKATFPIHLLIRSGGKFVTAASEIFPNQDGVIQGCLQKTTLNNPVSFIYFRERVPQIRAFLGPLLHVPARRETLETVDRARRLCASLPRCSPSGIRPPHPPCGRRPRSVRPRDGVTRRSSATRSGASKKTGYSSFLE